MTVPRSAEREPEQRKSLIAGSTCLQAVTSNARARRIFRVRIFCLSVRGRFYSRAASKFETASRSREITSSRLTAASRLPLQVRNRLQGGGVRRARRSRTALPRVSRDELFCTQTRSLFIDR